MTVEVDPRRLQLGIHLIGALTLISLCLVSHAAAGDAHDAARRGDLDELRSILSADPGQLNAQDQLGDTPLTLSAAYARWDVFEYLLEAGADVNLITRTNSTCMHCACYHDRPEMAELILERGGAPCLAVKDVFGEYTPMLRAVQRGNGNVIAFLLGNGAGPDEATKEGWNALHLAAKCGHRHLYGLLIEQGVSLDAIDELGNTPLTYDRRRPDPIPMDVGRYGEYAGSYCWQGDPDGACVGVFVLGDELMLDDNSLNAIYPTGEDLFYCDRDPWEVRFLRNEAGDVDRVQLTFLRRSVLLHRAK